MGGPRIHVGGDVLGQFVVGDHNVTVWAEQSVVTVLQPGERPDPRRRATIGLPPRRGTAPIGREQELAALLDAVAAGQLVQVYGVAGTGKSTLIRHAAGQLADDTPGVVFLSAAGRDVSDVLQDVFETCYETAGYRPGPVELRQFMAGVDIRLFVDDLEVVDDLLLDGVPDATIVFTSTQRTLWTDGHAVALSGLDQEPGLALLARLIDRPLRADERPAVTELWRASGGSPLQLLRAAASARRDADGSLVLPMAAELGELLPRIFAMLGGAAREAVAVLALGGGIGGDLLPWLVSDAPGASSELANLGVVISAGRGYQLAPGVVVPSDFAMNQLQLAWVVSRLQEWARVPGLAPQAVADHVGLITGVIRATVAAGRPELGGQLARVTAPLAACSLRLGAWEQILRYGVEAARLAGDRATVAYLTHEDGVHKLITGQRVAAVAAVGAAIAIWHELGDTAHIALAQHVQGVAVPATSHAVGGAVAHAGVAHQAVLGAKAGAITAKAGLGIGAKLTIAGVATAVVAGAAVGVTVLASPKHQSPPAPVAVSAPQLTGVQLASALVPVDQLPAGYTDWQAKSSGASLNTGRPTVQFASMTCTELFGGGYTDGAVVSPSGLGATSYAGAVSTSNADLADNNSEYEINQQIIQFPTPALASSYFHNVRTVLTTCGDWTTGRPVGSSVDVAPVGGHSAIMGRHSPPIANPGGGNNPIEMDMTFFTLSGLDVYLVGYARIAGQTPLSTMPDSQTTLSLVTKLIGNVRAVSAGRSITTVAPTTTVPAPTTSVPDAGPAGVVQAYVAAINSHDYQTAWNIAGQQTGQSYGQFVAGFAATDHDAVSIVSVQGGVVVADLTAYQTDGSHQIFHGTYTVSNGVITHSSVQRTG